MKRILLQYKKNKDFHKILKDKLKVQASLGTNLKWEDYVLYKVDNGN